MFVFNSEGAYFPALRPPGTFNPEKDPRVLQVRARRRGDLERLREHYLPELGKTIRLKQTDYQYRAYCTPAQWGQALARMAEEIDYVKFKDTAKDDQLHDTLLGVWTTVFSRMSPRPRGRRGRRGGRAGGFSWDNSVFADLPRVGESDSWTDEQYADLWRDLRTQP